MTPLPDPAPALAVDLPALSAAVAALPLVARGAIGAVGALLWAFGRALGGALREVLGMLAGGLLAAGLLHGAELPPSAHAEDLILGLLGIGAAVGGFVAASWARGAGMLSGALLGVALAQGAGLPGSLPVLAGAVGAALLTWTLETVARPASAGVGAVALLAAWGAPERPGAILALAAVGLAIQLFHGTRRGAAASG